MRVKPKSGALVRDPRSRRALPVEGADVPETSWWLRRLRAGDVVVIEPQNAERADTALREPEEGEQ